VADQGRRPLRIRVEGVNLPGRTFCEHGHVHVAVQRRSEAVDPVPGDATEAIFEFDVEVLAFLRNTCRCKGTPPVTGGHEVPD
jgi:hypothetical protein